MWNIDYPRGGPPGANNMGPISYYICIYFIINHQSSLITHQSSVINHQSSIISYQSSIIHDQWSIISHQFVLNQKRTSATKWVGNRIHGVLIGETEAETWDLSLLQWFRGVIKGCRRPLWRKTMAVLMVMRGVKKTRSRNLVLEPKLWLYEPHRGRNRC